MKHLPAIAVVLALVAVEFYPVANFQYNNWDDDQYITENPRLARGVTSDNLAWALTGPHVGNWHPLATLSHLVDIELFGLDPRGPHIENVVLHALNALLVYGVWFSLGGGSLQALAVAALFAVHPLRVESVAWVTERKDLLCAMFWLLTMSAYLRYAERPNLGRYAITTALLALALLSKPMAVTLPVALLLVDFLRLRFRAPPKNLITEKGPWFAMSLAVVIITFLQQLQFGGVRSLAEIPLWMRACNAEISYLVYLRQMVWPAGLACYYPYAVTTADQPMPRYMFLAQGGAALAVLIAMTWLAFRLRHKTPYLLFGWLWYLVTLLPVIGLAQAGLQAHADRFTYLPSLGIATAVVWGLGDLLRWRWPADFQQRSTIGSVLVGIAVALCLLIDRPVVASWQDSEKLFRRALDVAPSAVAHFHLGLYLDQNHRQAKALDEYREALAIDPRDARTRNNLAAILWFDGDREAAIAEYRKAVTLDPRLAIVRENLGEALLETGDVAGALENLTVAVECDSDSARAHYHLGRARAALGQLRPAEGEFRAALRLKPDWAEAHNNLGAVLMQQGHFDQAENEFTAALSVDPSLIDAHVNRAVLLAERGRLDAARDEFDLALRSAGLDTSMRQRILETMEHYHLASPQAEKPRRHGDTEGDTKTKQKE